MQTSDAPVAFLEVVRQEQGFQVTVDEPPEKTVAVASRAPEADVAFFELVDLVHKHLVAVNVLCAPRSQQSQTVTSPLPGTRITDHTRPRQQQHLPSFKAASGSVLPT